MVEQPYEKTFRYKVSFELLLILLYPMYHVPFSIDILFSVWLLTCSTLKVNVLRLLASKKSAVPLSDVRRGVRLEPGALFLFCYATTGKMEETIACE